MVNLEKVKHPLLLSSAGIVAIFFFITIEDLADAIIGNPQYGSQLCEEIVAVEKKGYIASQHLEFLINNLDINCSKVAAAGMIGSGTWNPNNLPAYRVLKKHPDDRIIWMIVRRMKSDIGNEYYVTPALSFLFDTIGAPNTRLIMEQAGISGEVPVYLRKYYSDWSAKPDNEWRAVKESILEKLHDPGFSLSQFLDSLPTMKSPNPEPSKPSPSVTPPSDTPSDDSHLILLIQGVLLAVFAGLVFIGYKMSLKKG